MSAIWTRPAGPPATIGEERVNTNRGIAVATGVLFIIATLGGLASTVLLTPILGAPDYLTRISANENQVLLGALFQFIAAAACPAIAIALYPVLRRHNEGLALGSVGFRLIEGALYVVVVICLLLLVTLSQESVKGGAPASSAFQVPGVLLMAARDWLGPVGAVLTFGLGALMYYWVFYRSRLIPRWLSAWGLVGATSVTVSGLLVMFRLTDPLSTTQAVLALPIAVQEMVLAAWLIARGFDPIPAPRGELVPRPSRRASATTMAGG
jgi:hypothetical protein